MKFVHDKGVVDKYPNNFTGIVKVLGFNDFNRLHQEIELLKEKIPSVFKHVEMERAVNAWKDVFVKMGAKLKYKSSLVAAYDFYRNNHCLYKINTVVDFYNHYSLANMVPMGAYDVLKVSGDLYLEVAKKDMEFIGIGSRDIQRTKEGEIIYRDDERVLCRYWNLKDSDITKITDETRDIIFMFDFIKENHEEASADFAKIVNDFKTIFGSSLVSYGLSGTHLTNEFNI